MAQGISNDFNSIDCPSCWETFTERIYICVKGHSICEVCSSKLKSCPFCRRRMTEGRNYVLEGIVGDISKNENVQDRLLISLITSNEVKLLTCTRYFTYKGAFSTTSGADAYDINLIKYGGKILKFCVKLDHAKKMVLAALQMYRCTNVNKCTFLARINKTTTFACKIAPLTETEDSFNSNFIQIEQTCFDIINYTLFVKCTVTATLN